MNNTENVIQFDRSDLRLLDLAVRRREKGDYEGALATLFSLEDNGCKLIDVLSEIATTYMDLGLYTHATKYWFRYLAHCTKNKQSRAFNALGACYFYMDNFPMSGYYFERQIIQFGDEPQEYDDVMMEFYDGFSEIAKPDFYLCYPEKNIPSSRIVEESDVLFLKKDFKGAEEMLAGIEKDDEYYSEAQSKIAACKFCEKDLDGAIEVLKSLVESDGKDKLALINLIGMFFVAGRGKEAEPYFKMCEELDFKESAECYKLAASYCDAGKTEMAEKYLEKAVADEPYDINSVFLLALVYYNLKKFKNAEKYFSRCYKITQSPTAKYYCKLCRDTADGVTEFRTLSYVFNVPKNEISDRIDLIRLICEHDVKVINKIPKEVLLELCEWTFSFESKAQEPLTEALLRSKSPSIRRFFLNRLIDPTVGDEIKSLILTKLAESGYDKKVGAVFGFIFSKIQLLRAEFDKEKNGVFNSAYALAFGKLAPLEPDKTYKIRDAAYSLYYTLKDNGNLRKISDVNALAGAIAILSEFKVTEQKSIIAEYFLTAKDKIKKIIDLSKE